MSRNASTDELYFLTLTVVHWVSYFHQAVIDQKIDYIHENPVREEFEGAGPTIIGYLHLFLHFESLLRCRNIS
ncbi:hypothetical protein SAMN05216524_10721 [Mucilaginibacter sp. OK098]|nr:hypothetical protein SAMN05216524_10721 [Mucilaginibacter sp. OK098]